jgi:UDP-N-acetylmuramoyl-tripeptide--D-alanyl-D-alanine ligase
MKPLHIDTLIKITDGKLYSEFEKNFEDIGTDTRKSLKGKLFIALKGDAFDAHDFCVQAVQQGAAGILIHRLPKELEELRKKVSVIVVKDTLTALQKIARHQRHSSGASFVALTGSNGKTTSKEFSAAIVGHFKRTHFSRGSFNNHWGVPFSILAEPAGTEVTILEMGMNHAGEIRDLCAIADPDIVVCSTVGKAHIEHFGSIEKIAEAKEEIYKYAPARARRIYNLDNPWTMKMYLRGRTEFPKADRLLSFSQMNAKADVFMQIESMTLESMVVTGRILGVLGRAEVPVFGAQNLTNLMVASSVGIALGMEPKQVWEALGFCKTIWGRNQIVHTKSGAQILFDAYNANPDSVGALLDNLPIIKAPTRMAVLAEMLELGPESATSHFEIGQKAGASGLDLIYFYGEHFADFTAGVKASGFNKTLLATKTFEESAAKELAHKLKSGDFIIVKGSRGMKMERFVQACDPLDFGAY